MFDLMIGYDNENGERVTKGYDTIMDFIDKIESDNSVNKVFDFDILNKLTFDDIFFSFFLVMMIRTIIITAIIMITTVVTDAIGTPTVKP